MSKQDRQGARTAQDLEYKYSFGKTFAEVMGYATDARNAANAANDAAKEANDAAKDASGAVNELDRRLNQEEVFNRLTNNGQAQGIYRDPETGEIYINASYLATGIISSADGSLQIDLLNNEFTLFTETNGIPGKVVFKKSAVTFYGWDVNTNDYVYGLTLRTTSYAGGTLPSCSYVTGAHTDLRVQANQGKTVYIGQASNPVVINGLTVTIEGKEVSWKSNGDGTYTLIGQ